MNNLYKDLHYIDIARAINQTVEDLFPRFTVEKVLVVDIRMSVTNYKKNKAVHKEFCLVYYRPSNYTFVGMCDKINRHESTSLEYLSYHDSCWRSDGTEHNIRKIASELDKQFENDKSENLDAYCGFGLHGYQIFDGVVKTNSDGRTAEFNPIKK